MPVGQFSFSKGSRFQWFAVCGHDACQSSHHMVTAVFSERATPTNASPASIAALLSKSAAAQLRLGCVGRRRILFATSWQELSQTVMALTPELAVFDVAFDETPNLEMIRALRRTHAGTSLVACVEIKPDNMRKVLLLTRLGVECAVMSGDWWPSFWSTIDRLASRSYGDEFFALFENSFRALPAKLQLALQDLFARPFRYQTSDDLATQAELSLRRTYVLLHRAGLPTPSRLIAVASLLYFYGARHTGHELPLEQGPGMCHPRSPWLRQLQKKGACWEYADFLVGLQPDDLMRDLLEWSMRPSSPTRTRSAQT